MIRMASDDQLIRQRISTVIWPPDCYRDCAQPRTASEAGQEICKLFPSAEQTLIDALWAARQRLA